jgi:hypothetical protein
MDNLVTLFDHFYTRFVLRDFLAKIIHGSILLIGFLLLYESPLEAIKAVDQIPTSILLLSIGIAWLVAFVLQLLVIIIDMLANYTFKLFRSRISKDEKSQQNRKMLFHTDRVKIWRYSTDDEKRLLERYIVIREATGNGSMSSLSVGLIFSYHGFDRAITLYLFIVGFMLLCSHFMTYRDQQNYIDAIKSEISMG